MASRTRRLDALRRAAEAAVGSLRQVADHLDEIADLLGERSPRRLGVEQNADRLRAAALLLNAEVNASNPSTARKVAEVAGTALLWIGAGTLPGVAEGVSATIVESAMSSQARATDCVAQVRAAATAAEADLASAVEALTSQIRQHVLGLLTRNVGSGRARPSAVEPLIRHLEAPDMDVPNARQRWVALTGYLRRFGEMREAFASGPDDEELMRELGQQLTELREMIEILAETDDSLYPPQLGVTWD